MPAQRTRRGYLVAEIAIGIAVLTALAMSLTVTVSRQNEAAEALADRRTAARIADQVMLSLQSEKVTAPNEADATITTRPLPGDAPAGRQWVEVRVEHNGQTATLYGLATTARLPNAEGRAQ